MPFLGQEKHVLDCWRASSSTEKGVSLKREECGCWNILTVSIYLISVYSLTEDSSFSHEGHFFFSQNYTEEQNTQTFTETLSQPISQNLTANFSWNALCSLYAEGLLWARNVRQKPPWTLCALWEKNISFVRKNYILSERKNKPRTLLAAQ